MLKSDDSDIYNVINNLVDENRELMERLLEELYNQMKTCKTYREAYFMFEDFLLKKTEPKYPT